MVIIEGAYKFIVEDETARKALFEQGVLKQTYMELLDIYYLDVLLGMK